MSKGNKIKFGLYILKKAVMDYKKIKGHFVFTTIIIISCCSLSSANYYRYIVPPDSVMAIEKASELKPYLKSDSDIIKIWGIIRLGQIGNENDIGRLVEIYENEPDQLGFMPPPRVKYHCLIAIGEIGGQKAEQAIMNIAEKSELSIDANSSNISAGICDALGEIGSPTAIKTLQSIPEGKTEYGDWTFAKMNLYKLDLRKPEFATFQDSILYLLNIMERINTDRKGRSSGDNSFIHRAVEITFLDILNSENIGYFEKIVENRFTDHLTKAYCENIVKLVELKLRWHTGQYTLVDGLAGAVPTILSNNEIDSLSTLLDDSNCTDHASMFHNVLLRENADTTKFIDLLLRALTMESQSPCVFPFRPGSVPMTSLLIRMYIMYVVDNGKYYIPMLKSIADKSSGDMSNWAVVSLGLFRCSAIKSNLDSIILNNPNPYMRSWAVWALSEFNDPDDYEIFVKALSDTFYFHVYSDVFLEDGKSRDYDNYIVGSQAFYALRNLGFSVRWDSTGNYHIEPEKK